MPCYRPLTAWRAPGGGVVFSKVEGCSVTPLTLPCGQCRGCRLERARSWALRCMHEATLHAENSFLTLTYSPQKLPWDLSLDKKHFQDFMKRLRKHYGGRRIRYYHCGEYGDENLRPHYHALLFGVSFCEDRQVWKSTAFGDLYVSPLLERVWGKGFCTIGSVDFRSAAYVARYVMKKQSAKYAEETGVYKRQEVDHETGEVVREWHVQPEYATMSRRPGIGAGWYEKYKKDCYPSDFCVNDGKKLRVPKYYDTLLERENPELLDRLKKRRFQAAQRHEKENTWERLRVRERLAEKRGDNFGRQV